MAVHLRRGGTEGLSKLLEECATDEFTYQPIGGSLTYGTLRVHPERGEEAFVVTRQGSGARFDVDAISRPAE